MGEVKVIGLRTSPYSMRVEMALKIKGVAYQLLEEDLLNKSEELFKYNPVHKKIPVLVHDGKPVAESLAILEYIDETWPDNPLLPNDPYDRVQARFWAKFIDEKLTPAIRNAILVEEEMKRQKAQEEAHELLKVLENEINEEKFSILGGNGTEIGYLDIVATVTGYWQPALQEAVGKELLTREKYPALFAWIDKLLANCLVTQILPPKVALLKMYNIYLPFICAKVNASK